MSCDAVASVALLWLAATAPDSHAMAPERTPRPTAVALEPLFADIVQRAGALKAQAEALKAGSDPVGETFRRQVGELSALDMKGHVTLAQRGTDGDLKCILKGISEDLPLKLAAVDEAKTPAARADALSDMIYLLNDNVEVITAPPQPPV